MGQVVIRWVAGGLPCILSVKREEREKARIGRFDQVFIEQTVRVASKSDANATTSADGRVVAVVRSSNLVTKQTKIQRTKQQYFRARIVTKVNILRLVNLLLGLQRIIASLPCLSLPCRGCPPAYSDLAHLTHYDTSLPHHRL